MAPVVSTVMSWSCEVNIEWTNDITSFICVSPTPRSCTFKPDLCADSLNMTKFPFDVSVATENIFGNRKRGTNDAATY